MDSATYKTDRTADNQRKRGGLFGFVPVGLSLLLIAAFSLVEVDEAPNLHPAYVSSSVVAQSVVLVREFHEKHAFDLDEIGPSELRDELPSSIPLDEEPVTERIVINTAEVEIYQRLEGSNEETFRQNEQRFTQAGWELVSQADLSSGWVQQWRSNEQACQVQIGEWRHRSEKKMQCWTLESALEALAVQH